MAAIKFQKPSLFRRDMDAVLQTMVDEKIGPGDKKRLFVKVFSVYCTKKNGVALRTFPDAIYCTLLSLGIKEGDGVAVSVLTPDVYLDAFKRIGAKAVLCDVDDDMMISVDSIKAQMDKNIKAIVYFEPLGQFSENVEGIKELGIPVIEDISQSIGSTFNGKKPGKVGDIIIASTEEDAIVSTGGGAVVLTDNETYFEEMKKYVNEYLEMADLNAALGIVQLEKMESVVSRRNNIWKTYQKASMKGGAKMFGQGSVDFSSNGYGFSVIVNERPDETIAFALKYQVTARKTFSKAIGARYQDRYDKYPKAVPALSRGVSFPLYPFLSSSEIDTIQKVIAHLR